MSDPQKILQGFITRKKIYLFIRDYTAREKIPPSIREIVDGAGISSTSIVAHHLEILRKEGVVVFTPSANRTIVLVGVSVILPPLDERYAGYP